MQETRTPQRSYTDQDVLTIPEAAEYLRVSQTTVYKHLKLLPDDPERIPSVNIGRRHVIVFWQLREWLAAQAGMTAPATISPRFHH